MKSLGIVITNGVKLAGLAVGLFSPHGAFSPHPEALILATAGFMMAGAQLSEQTLFGILERFLGRSSTPEETKKLDESGASKPAPEVESIKESGGT